MKVFIILAGLLMLGACTGKPEGFVLKGELKGAPDDHWVFLTNTGQTHYYDSTRLKNGRFEFKGKVDGPELRCITYFKDPSQRVFGWDKILNIPVYVENAAIQVTLPFAEMPSKLQKELPAGLQVKGSESHDLYMAYKRRVTPFVLQMLTGMCIIIKKERKKTYFAVSGKWMPYATVSFIPGSVLFVGIFPLR